jgi:predicted dehydrogenase
MDGSSVLQLKDHKAAAIKAIEAGKDLYVEWPLGANLAEAEEMTKLAQKKGVKTVVGLQTRQRDGILKVCNLLSV